MFSTRALCLPPLAHRRVITDASAHSVFQTPWDKILQSTDALAASHQLFAHCIDKDVEQPLRGFQTKREMGNMQTIGANLGLLARELDDSQDKVDRLTRKGGRANAQKVDQATTKLESATSQWDSQAPFVLESLQALDEQRINHLRDLLTQLLTHEVDQATRSQAAAEEALNIMLEINTTQEVQNFVQRATAGKPKLERRTPTITRQTSAVTTSSPAPPRVSANEDDVSEHSGPKEPQSGKLLRAEPVRLGTRECGGLEAYTRGRIETAKPNRYNAGATEAEHTWRIRSHLATEDARSLYAQHGKQPREVNITTGILIQLERRLLAKPAVVPSRKPHAGRGDRDASARRQCQAVTRRRKRRRKS
jgi:hypothetical protein